MYSYGWWYSDAASLREHRASQLFQHHLYGFFGFLIIGRSHARHTGEVDLRLAVNRLGVAEGFKAIKAVIAAHATWANTTKG